MKTGLTRPARFMALAPLGLMLTASFAGCASPYHQDRGALFGGLTGAGVGALVGNAVGEPLAGAAIGAGVGAITGAAVGQSLDDIEARNRAQIEAQIGRRLAAGSVTVEDVIAMTRSGVDEQIILNHVRVNGSAKQLQPADLIYLQNSGVSSAVILAMQQPPIRPANASQPVVVEEIHHYDPWGPPYYGPSFGYHHHHGPRWHRRPRMGWGFSISN
jgi:hypothetical protein